MPNGHEYVDPKYELWNLYEKYWAADYPDRNFWLTLMQLHPEGLGDPSDPYTKRRIQDMWYRYEAGALAAPGGEVAPPAEEGGTISPYWTMISPYEHMQVGMGQQGLDIERQREARLGRESRWQMQQEPGVSEAEMERRMREQLAAEYAGPADWIKRWMILHPERGPNITQQQQLAEQGLGRISEAQRTATEAERTWMGSVAGGQGGYIENLEAERDWATATSNLLKAQEKYSNVISKQQALAQRQMADVSGFGETTIGMAGEGRRPTEPPAPSWLSQFVPSQVSGEPITKAPTRTPSGQQWGATPWSTREGLRGYTEWAGHRPYPDILEHMAMMQPEAPRGAKAKRWQPVRQWT